MFVRVRGATPGDPLHEFDIPLVTWERHKDLYEVIDRKPVAKQRPASHIPGVVPEQKTSTTVVDDAPSEGPTQGEKPWL